MARSSNYVINFNLDELRVRPGDTIVDVGCGDGPFDRPLVEAGFDVIGVEPEAYLRKRFAAWAGRLGPGQAKVRAGTAEKLPFRSGSVRRLVITEVLEHVSDPEVCLREIARVMKRGGVVCVSVPTARTERVFWKLHPDYEKNSTHLRIFRKSELLKAIERAGFTVRRVEGRNYAASLIWLVHVILRSESDHAGKIKTNRWVESWSDHAWRLLNAIYVGRALNAIGNKVWPKSWYVYAEKQ